MGECNVSCSVALARSREMLFVGLWRFQHRKLGYSARRICLVSCVLNILGCFGRESKREIGYSIRV